MKKPLLVLRVRKNVPGIGRKIANHFGAQEVVCGYHPTNGIPANAVVFNYGRSQLPIWWDEAKAKGAVMINNPAGVGKCVDKIKTLDILNAKGIPCVEHTTDANFANDMWLANGDSVIARSTTTGKQGNGISLYVPYENCHLSNDGINFDNFNYGAPLYTKYFPKTHEFRVHVFGDKVIDIRQKKRMSSKTLAERGLELDEVVRNHKRGWVFAKNDLICDTPQGNRSALEQISLEASKELGMDYCGVDLLAIYGPNGNLVNAVVCEVNSAPNMRGSTFDVYAKEIEARLQA